MTKEDMIDLKCAEAGIPLLPAKPVKPVYPKVECWDIGGFYFTNKEDAQRVLDAIEQATAIYSTVGWDETRRLDQIKMTGMWAPQLTKSYIMTENTWLGRKNELEVYEAELKEYQRILALRSPIVDKIEAALQEADEHAAALQHLVDMFKRYVKLADGNQTVAFNFLIAAYPDMTDEMKSFIYPEWTMRC